MSLDDISQPFAVYWLDKIIRSSEINSQRLVIDYRQHYDWNELKFRIRLKSL